MTDLWLSLLPILLAISISPARTLALILLLHTPKQAATATAYVLGMIGAMMGQGLLLGLLMSLIGLTVENRGGDLKTVIAILFIVAGTILLTGALKFWAHEDDDKAPPAWLEKIEQMTPAQGFKLGIGWLIVSPKQWVMVLTAVAVIFAAYLPPLASAVNFLVFTLLAQIVYVLILGLHLLMPQRSEAILDRLFGWVKRHLRLIAIGLFGFLGLFFLWQGISELIG